MRLTASNPDVDKGGAPQVAHVAARQRIEALAHQAFGDLVARRRRRRGAGRRLVADHDDPDAVLLNDRLRSLPDSSPKTMVRIPARSGSSRKRPSLDSCGDLLFADLEQVLAVLGDVSGVLSFGDAPPGARPRSPAAAAGKRPARDASNVSSASALARRSGRRAGRGRAANNSRRRSGLAATTRPAASGPPPLPRSGLSCSGRTQPEIAADGGRRRLRELLRDCGKPGTVLHLLGQPFG